MNRYILKYKGSDEKELAIDLALVKKAKNLTVIDGNSKLMLVETDEKTKAQLESKLDKWIFFQQAMISKPDNKKKLKGKAYK